MLKEFIWDFDGTLYDTYTIMLDAFMQTLKDYGVDAKRAEIYRLLKSESSASVAAKYNLDFAEFSEIFQNYERQDQRVPVSYEGTKAMLESIVKQGYNNYIYTHRTVASTKELLEREGMLHLFAEIVGPENKFPRKPDPAGVTYLVDKFQLNPIQTVMIGDRPMDIGAGKNAGVKTIFYDLEQLLPNVEADYTVRSIAEMVALIK